LVDPPLFYRIKGGNYSDLSLYHSLTDKLDNFYKMALQSCQVESLEIAALNKAKPYLVVGFSICD
jgi:hypothetical protein